MLSSVLMNEENAHKIIKKRILAAWIDILLFIIPITYINNPILLLIFPLNYVVLPYSQGYTIGMLLMHIRIINVSSDEMNKLKVLQLLARSVYFYTIYPWENILSRGIVRISQVGQTKLDHKFNTSVVFKNSIWDQNAHIHTYESYLHHMIFFAILFIYFISLLSLEILSNYIK